MIKRMNKVQTKKAIKTLLVTALMVVAVVYLLSALITSQNNQGGNNTLDKMEEEAAKLIIPAGCKSAGQPAFEEGNISSNAYYYIDYTCSTTLDVATKEVDAGMKATGYGNDLAFPNPIDGIEGKYIVYYLSKNYQINYTYELGTEVTASDSEDTPSTSVTGLTLALKAQ